MINPLEIALILAWSVAAAGLAAYAASVAREVTYVTLADGRRQERSFPLAFKMLLPFVGNLDRLVSRPSFKKAVTEANTMLVAGGYEGLVDGKEFVALRILVPVVMGVLWSIAIVLFGAVLPDSLFTSSRIELCLLGIVLFALQPTMWLKNAVKKRHWSIMKSLPFVLDLVGRGGHGFHQRASAQLRYAQDGSS